MKWTELAKYLYYPIIINDTYYRDQSDFQRREWAKIFTIEYREGIANGKAMNILVKLIDNYWCMP